MKKITKKGKSQKMIIATLLVSGFALIVSFSFRADKAVGRSGGEKAGVNIDVTWNVVTLMGKALGGTPLKGDDGYSYSASTGKDKYGYPNVVVFKGVPSDTSDDDAGDLMPSVTTIYHPDSPMSKDDNYAKGIRSITKYDDDNFQDNYISSSGDQKTVFSDGTNTDNDPIQTYNKSSDGSVNGYVTYPSGDIDGVMLGPDDMRMDYYTTNFLDSKGNIRQRTDGFFYTDGKLVSAIIYYDDKVAQQTDYNDDGTPASTLVDVGVSKQLSQDAYIDNRNQNYDSDQIPGSDLYFDNGGQIQLDMDLASGSGYVPHGGFVSADYNGDPAYSDTSSLSNQMSVVSVNGNSVVSNDSSYSGSAYAAIGSALGGLDFSGDISSDDMNFILSDDTLGDVNAGIGFGDI